MPNATRLKPNISLRPKEVEKKISNDFLRENDWNLSNKEVDTKISSWFRKIQRLLSFVRERIKGEKFSKAYLPTDLKVVCYHS